MGRPHFSTVLRELKNLGTIPYLFPKYWLASPFPLFILQGVKTILLAIALLLSVASAHAALGPLQRGHFAGAYSPTGCSPGWSATPGYITLSTDITRFWAARIYDNAGTDYTIYGRLSPLGRFVGVTPSGARFTGIINRQGVLRGRWTGPPRTCHGTFSALRTGP